MSEPPPGTEVIFIGGGSGTGKSTLGWACHELLSQRQLAHALIEGDNLDMTWPPAWPEHPLTEQNLAAMWRNMTALGYRRLIYTNTASVRPDARQPLVEALASVCPPVRAVSVLLTADRSVVEDRLGRREVGDSVRRHVERSVRTAGELADLVDDDTLRIATDGRTPDELAVEVLTQAGWITADGRSADQI